MMHTLTLVLALLGSLAVSDAQRVFNTNPDFANGPLSGEQNAFVVQLNGPPPSRPDNDDRRPPQPRPFDNSADGPRQGPPPPPPHGPENPPPPPADLFREGPPPPPPQHGPENSPPPPVNTRYVERTEYITMPLSNVRVISQADAPAFFAAVQQQPQSGPIGQRLIVVQRTENTQFGSPNNNAFIFRNTEQRFRPDNVENRFLISNNQNFQTQNLPGRVMYDAPAVFDDAPPMRTDVFSNGMIGGGGVRAQDSVNKQPDLVLSNYYINFRHQFDRVNPRNPNSEWRWSELNGYAADKGTFVRDALSSIDLTAIPFTNKTFLQNLGRVSAPPDTERLAALTNYEAVVVNKRKIQLEPTQEVTARFSFTCKVFNVEQQPFPANVVSNGEDDPSLANCGFSIATHGDTSLMFSIVATNKGIWAVYERNRYLLAVDGDRNQNRVFTIFHRLASRKSNDEIIDASMTLDRSKNHVNFFLNGQKVWNVTRLGTIPQDEPSAQQHSLERPDVQQVVDPSEVLITFGLGKYMDEYDPNNPTRDGLRKQRFVKQSNYYDPSAKFYDDDAKPELNEFGQGATMTLYDAVIQVKQDQPPTRVFGPPQVMLAVMPNNNRQLKKK